MGLPPGGRGQRQRAGPEDESVPADLILLQVVGLRQEKAVFCGVWCLTGDDYRGYNYAEVIEMAIPLGQRIADARVALGMTQTDVARAMGVVQVSVSDWETGGNRPDIRRLPALAKLLQVSLEELFRDEEEVEDA